MNFYQFSIILLYATITSHSIASETDPIIESGYDLPYLWDTHAGYVNPDWMSKIDDSIALGKISIPGTHNSLSLYGGDIPTTQTLHITEQLNMGIRYLDVRFKYKDGNLYAYHGLISQHMTFDTLLSDVSNFLNANPSETILIRIQNADGAAFQSEAFYNKFKEVRNKYSERNTVPFHNNPIISEVRGKFIFIRDFETFDMPIGIRRDKLFIQDEYKLDTNYDLYDKWETIKDHFYKIDGSKISLNYLSGSVGSFPYFVASGKSSPQSHAPQLWTGISTTDPYKYSDFPRRDCLVSLCSIYFAGTNQLTNKFIEKGYFQSNLGVVVADFPGARLVKNIIESNFQTGKPPSEMPIIYEDFDQKGKALSIQYDIRSLGEMNDQLSSWDIPKGWSLRFFEHDDYQGRYYTRHAGTGNAHDFNKLINSIKILKRP